MSNTDNKPTVQHNNALDEIIAQRYDEVEAIRKLGVVPYPNRCERKISCAEAKNAEDNFEAVTTGRLVQIRLMGKAAFAHLRDFSGRVQLYIAKDNIGDESYAFFKKYISVGDFVSVTGHVFVTKTGEKTIKATKLTLISKAIRPMPEKYHGLQDTEMRFRKRHLDLIANEDVKEIFIKRAKIISSIRKTLDAKGFLEVETPILNPSSGGAIARPFETFHNALKMPLFMRIALELHHKRLIIGGIDRIYEIGHMFRNEGIDTTHNPEFTMMELYQAYGDVNTMADLFDEILGNAAKAIGVESIHFRGYDVDLRPPFKRLYIPVAWKEKFGKDIHEVLNGRHFNREKLEEVAREQGIKFTANDSDSSIFDELFEGKLLADYHNPVIALDYPTAVSPFAKTKPGDPELVERFEVFVNGQELGNAYTELNDPADQLQRLKDQAAAKAIAKGEDAENADILDADYIEAMESGMPPTGGMGIGIDRIIMMLTGQDSIREIIFFPTMKALDSDKKPQTTAKVVEQMPEKIDFSKVQIEPLFADQVDFDTFSKSDFRVVKVKNCIAVPKSKKLLAFTLDDGTGTDRTILSGIHAFYEPEELIGKTLVAITNLPPREMMGLTSNGMLLSAIHQEEGQEKLHLVMLDDHIPAGAKLY